MPNGDRLELELEMELELELELEMEMELGLGLKLELSKLVRSGIQNVKVRTYQFGSMYDITMT